MTTARIGQRVCVTVTLLPTAYWLYELVADPYGQRDRVERQRSAGAAAGTRPPAAAAAAPAPPSAQRAPGAAAGSSSSSSSGAAPARGGPAGTPQPAPVPTEPSPRPPRCSGPWAPPSAVLREAPRRLWYSGCVGGPGGAKSGLNNQRQTLMSAVMLAAAADSLLVIGPFGVNAHDMNSSLTWSDFYDLAHLSQELPRGAVTFEAAGGCVPAGTPSVEFPALWWGDNSTYDIDKLAAHVRSSGRDVELFVDHHVCSGHPFWRYKRSSPEALARGDAVLRRALRFPQQTLDLGRRLLEAARASNPTGSGRVHCIHQRVKYTADHMNFPFAPLMNCTASLQSLSSECEAPPHLTCFCVNPLKKPSNTVMRRIVQAAASAEIAKEQLRKERFRPAHIDFDWHIVHESKRGLWNRSDTVLIASNDPTHPRIDFTADAVRQSGAWPVVAAELAKRNAELGAAMRAVRSPVLFSAVEQAACAAADGRFYPSCLSSVSEVVVDMRRWRGIDPEAERQARLMHALLSNIGLLQVPVHCLALEMRGGRQAKMHKIPPTKVRKRSPGR
eukprot:TRINITY_DN18935_c0_g3_i1.p1 TRINITY_DN18935_c0_g3~~TRINITY_DN18935_c0_g3_i1.p1  ORF type:complete len:558 (+),score=160.82 TRINITY_DN18935_c0_g3_i1:106-1779(+)